jgi:hypothetical protein
MKPADFPECRVWLALLSGDSQPPVYVEARRQYFKDGEEE